MNDIENKLKSIYSIESETKIKKLLEEFNELATDMMKYIANPSYDNMILLLGELIDVNIVILQIAIVKHSIMLDEILSMAKDKLNLIHRIKLTMKKKRIGYLEARRMHRED